jgi:hypothetical protein
VTTPYVIKDFHVALIQTQVIASVTIGGRKRIGAVVSSDLDFYIDPNDASGFQNLTLFPRFVPLNDFPGANSVPPCASTAVQARVDPRFWDDPKCRFPTGKCYIYRPKPARCFRTKENNPSITIGQQCCYHDSGSLLTDPLEGGGMSERVVPDLSFTHAIYHLLNDIWPFLSLGYYNALFFRDDMNLQNTTLWDGGYVEIQDICPTCSEIIIGLTYGQYSSLLFDLSKYSNKVNMSFGIIDKLDDAFLPAVPGDLIDIGDVGMEGLTNSEVLSNLLKDRNTIRKGILVTLWIMCKGAVESTPGYLTLVVALTLKDVLFVAPTPSIYTPPPPVRAWGDPHL